MLPALPPAPVLEPAALQAPAGGKRESLEEFLAKARAKQAELFAKLSLELEALVKRIEGLSLPPSNQALQALIDECIALGPEATPLFVKWLDPGDAALEKERFRAKQIALVLTRMDTRAATAELLVLLAKGTTEGRIHAARVLETTPDRERVKAELIAAYRGSTGQLHSALLRTLLRVAPEDPQLLEEVLKGDDEAMCEVAINALTDSKNAAAEERVRQLLGNPERAAQHAMSLLLYYQAQPELVSASHLKDLVALAANSKVPLTARVAIIDSLPLFVSGSSNELKKSLDAVIQGPDLKLAEAARIVLARLGDKTAKRDLLKSFDELVETNPKWSQSYARRGEILRRIGDYREAEKDYVKALQLGKDESIPQPDTYIGLARCAALQGHMKDAKKWLQQAPIQLSQLKALSNDPDFAKLKASKDGDVFPKD